MENSSPWAGKGPRVMHIDPESSDVFYHDSHIATSPQSSDSRHTSQSILEPRSEPDDEERLDARNRHTSKAASKANAEVAKKKSSKKLKRKKTSHLLRPISKPKDASAKRTVSSSQASATEEPSTKRSRQSLNSSPSKSYGSKNGAGPSAAGDLSSDAESELFSAEENFSDSNRPSKIKSEMNIGSTGILSYRNLMTESPSGMKSSSVHKGSALSEDDGDESDETESSAAEITDMGIRQRSKSTSFGDQDGSEPRSEGASDSSNDIYETVPAAAATGEEASLPSSLKFGNAARDRDRAEVTRAVSNISDDTKSQEGSSPSPDFDQLVEAAYSSDDGQESEPTSKAVSESFPEDEAILAPSSVSSPDLFVEAEPETEENSAPSSPSKVFSPMHIRDYEPEAEETDASISPTPAASSVIIPESESEAEENSAPSSSRRVFSPMHIQDYEPEAEETDASISPTPAASSVDIEEPQSDAEEIATPTSHAKEPSSVVVQDPEPKDIPSQKVQNTPNDKADEPFTEIPGGEVNGKKIPLLACKMCPYTIHQKKNMVMHCKGHDANKNLKCDFCSWSSGRRDYLDKHMTVHAEYAEVREAKKDQLNLSNYQASADTPVLRYVCGVGNCPKSFHRSDHAQSHRSTHFGKVVCKLCERICASVQSYFFHKKTCEKRIETKSYECKVCKEGFTQRKLLEAHRKEQHVYTNCEECDELILKRSLRGHLLNQHRIILGDKRQYQLLITAGNTSENEHGKEVSDQQVQLLITDGNTSGHVHDKQPATIEIEDDESESESKSESESEQPTSKDRPDDTNEGVLKDTRTSSEPVSTKSRRRPEDGKASDSPKRPIVSVDEFIRAMAEGPVVSRSSPRVRKTRQKK